MSRPPRYVALVVCLSIFMFTTWSFQVPNYCTLEYCPPNPDVPRIIIPFPTLSARGCSLDLTFVAPVLGSSGHGSLSTE